MLASYSFITGVLDMPTIKVPQNTDKCVTLNIRMYNVPDNVVAFMEFSCPKGKKFISEPLEVIDKTISFAMPHALTKHAGDVYLQLNIKNKGDGLTIAKSFITANPPIVIEESINAAVDIPQGELHDLLSDAVATIVDMKELEERVSMKLSNGDFVGEKGDKGEDANVQLTDSLGTSHDLALSQYGANALLTKKIELLYDMQSNDELINLGYPQGIKKGDVIYKDFSKYKQLNYMFHTREINRTVFASIALDIIPSYDAYVGGAVGLYDHSTGWGMQYAELLLQNNKQTLVVANLLLTGVKDARWDDATETYINRIEGVLA